MGSLKSSAAPRMADAFAPGEEVRTAPRPAAKPKPSGRVASSLQPLHAWPTPSRPGRNGSAPCCQTETVWACSLKSSAAPRMADALAPGEERLRALPEKRGTPSGIGLPSLAHSSAMGKVLVSRAQTGRAQRAERRAAAAKVRKSAARVARQRAVLTGACLDELLKGFLDLVPPKPRAHVKLRRCMHAEGYRCKAGCKCPTLSFATTANDRHQALSAFEDLRKFPGRRGVIVQKVTTQLEVGRVGSFDLAGTFVPGGSRQGIFVFDAVVVPGEKPSPNTAAAKVAKYKVVLAAAKIAKLDFAKARTCVQGFWSLATSSMHFREWEVKPSGVLVALERPVASAAKPAVEEKLCALRRCTLVDAEGDTDEDGEGDTDEEQDGESEWVSVCSASRAVYGGYSASDKLLALLADRDAEIAQGRCKVGGRRGPVPCCRLSDVLAVLDNVPRRSTDGRARKKG